MGVFADLRRLLANREFRKLFAVRLVSQAGDGAFQVGLASVLFFSDTSTARSAAAGFSVLFAPFVVAPFVGVMLDRWLRRQVLRNANAVRGLVTLGAAVAMFLGAPTWVLVGVGLLALAINRFILSGLSAGMPTILGISAEPNEEQREFLLTANSVVPTMGTAATILGGGVGLLTSLFAPEGSIRDAAALTISGALMIAAAALAIRMTPTQLGPEHPASTPLRSAIGEVFRDLGYGARYLARRVTPGQGLLAMAFHRFIFGVVTIAAILMANNLYNPGDSAGAIATFAMFMAMITAGGFLAVVITPFVSRAMGPQVWVAIMLGVAAVSQFAMALSYVQWLVWVCAFLLGLAAQAAKIAVDTIVAKDTHDEFRGRAFSFYDLLFNAAYTGAAVLAAFVVPDTGWSRPLFFVLAAAYAVGAFVMATFGARSPREVDIESLVSAG